MKSLLKGLFSLMLIMVLLPQVAQATNVLTLTFNPSVQSVLQGGVLTFNGTLSFISGDGSPVYIAGDTITTSPGFGLVCCDIPSPDLIMLDDLPFFSGPYLMTSDDSLGPSSATFDFFTISVGSLVTPGTYLGTFDVMGGDSTNAFIVISSAPFQIDVTAPPTPPIDVPEPGSLVLLCSGLAAVGLRFRPTRPISKKRVP